MSLPIKKSDGSGGHCSIAFGDDLSIYNAANIHQELAGWLPDFETFDIDLSAVEAVDCSGVQILLALKLSLEKESKKMNLTSPSAAVSEIIELLNVRDKFTWSEASS